MADNLLCYQLSTSLRCIYCICMYHATKLRVTENDAEHSDCQPDIQFIQFDQFIFILSSVPFATSLHSNLVRERDRRIFVNAEHGSGNNSFSASQSVTSI